MMNETPAAAQSAGRRQGGPGRSLALLFAGVLLASGAIAPEAAEAASAAQAGAAAKARDAAQKPKVAGLTTPDQPVPKRKPAAKTSSKLRDLEALAEKQARRFGVDPNLVHAVILAESAYNPRALSHKGAMGLMQLIPGTARRYGVRDPWNPAQNISGGTRYLRDLMKMFGDLELVLAAYNAGENAVVRYGNSIPPYAETQVYVGRAMEYLARLQGGTPVSKLRRSGVAGRPRLSGWGIVFGSTFERSEAQALIKKNRAALKPVLRGGRSAVVKAHPQSGRNYTAVISGLDSDKAAAACQHLRAQNAYCLAIPPDHLKDPKALWR